MAPDPVVQFPAVIPGDDITVSATTFVAFKQCPEQAAGRFRGIYGPESIASFRGGLAHRVFARHLKSGPIADGEFEAACRQEIGSSMNHKMSALGLRPSQLKEVIATVSELYAKFKSVPTDGFEDGEVLVECEPAPGVTLKGAIDAVFDGGSAGRRLVDWKTGRVEGSEDQMAFYVLLWVLDRGELPGRIEAVSVGSGETASWVPTRTEVVETARQVAHLVDTMRRGWIEGLTMDRSGGPWCRYCPLLDECSEGASAIAVLGAG